MRPRDNVRSAVTWAGVVLAVVAFVVAVQAAGPIVQDCNFAALGLGRPSCEANVQAARGTLPVASAVLVIWIACFIVARRPGRP